VHTEKTLTGCTDPNTGFPATYDSKPGPSPNDEKFQRSVSGSLGTATAIQVDTKGGITVNFYDGNGTVKSISWASFIKMKD
jgi:hypothetical protein